MISSAATQSQGQVPFLPTPGPQLSGSGAVQSCSQTSSEMTVLIHPSARILHVTTQCSLVEKGTSPLFAVFLLYLTTGCVFLSPD